VSASASRNPAVEKRLGVLIVGRYIVLCRRWCAAEVQLDCLMFEARLLASLAI
jgi:hypothetical protein